MFEKEEHKGREMFHKAIHEHESGLPEDYSPIKESVYTASPTFVSEQVNNRKAMIKVSFKDNKKNSETTLLTSIEKEDSSGYEYNLLNRTVVDTPEEAAVIMIERIIPDMNDRLEH